jgi:hypothetical protein
MTDNHVTPTEVLDCLRFVRTHLYAAQAQAAPGDDAIITGHVRDAYKRASDVCREIETNGIGMAIPAVYHINATNNSVRFDDLATMMRRLIHALYVAPTDDHGNVHPLCHKAKALLQKYGLQSSPLREDEDEA